MNFEATGTVVRVKDAQQITERFAKRELWIEVPSGQYSETISIEFVNDRMSLLDSVGEGDEVTVSVNVKGRLTQSAKYPEGMVWNKLQGWKIQKDRPMEARSVESVDIDGNDEDELPF